MAENLPPDTPTSPQPGTEHRVRASIIIAHFNGIQILRDCLQALSRVKSPEFEVFVVDNGSSDGSVGWLASNYPDVEVIALPSNLGFAAASNMAIPRCRGDFIVFLNNDTAVEPDALAICIETLRADPTIGLCQPLIVHMHDPGIVDSAGTFITPFGFGWHRGHMQPASAFDAQIEIFTAKGACMVFPRQVIDEIGGFDTDFENYFEDDDLSWRVWLSGRRVVFVPRARVLHVGGATSSKMPWSHVHMLAYRNRIASILVNAGHLRLATVLTVHIGVCALLSVLYLVSGNSALTRSVLHAIGWNITNLPLLLSKRRRIQTRIRRVPDGDYWARVSRGGTIAGWVQYFLGMLKS